MSAFELVNVLPDHDEVVCMSCELVNLALRPIQHRSGPEFLKLKFRIISDVYQDF